jgi:5-methylthioadenosine/S-adenosylhomocysteine deaminase
VVSLDRAGLTPVYDPLSHLVYAARGSDVQTVIVNGRMLMRDKTVLTLDERAVLQEARAYAKAVRAATAH